MNLIAKVDEWLIIRIYESLSWRFEYRYGKNCFWLARVALTISLAALSARYNSIFLLLFLMAWASFMLIIREQERIISAQPHQQNYWKPKWQMRLLIFCIMLLVMLSMHYDSWYEVVEEVIRGLLFLSVFYLLSCNSMPPKWEPKKREATEKLAHQIA